MKKRIVTLSLLIGFVAGGIALFSAAAMAHGGYGMMNGQHSDTDRVPCQEETYSGAMHHGDGHGMMDSMMGNGRMGSMMHGGNGRHMMDLDDMRHGGMLNQADDLGLSDDQVSKLNAIRLSVRKDIIQKEAEVKIARLELSELVASDNWSVKDTEPLVQKIENLEGDIHLRQLEALSDARKILTADQFKQYSSTGHLSTGEHYCN